MVTARANPHRVAPALLARYVGTYGQRTLTVRDGGLVFRRIPYPPRPLIALNDSTFSLATLERVTVENARAGKPRLVLVQSEGDTVRSERTGPVR